MRDSKLHANSKAHYRTTERTNPDDQRPRQSSLLVGAVLHELAADAEAVLLIAKALEDHAGTSSAAAPQKLREMAALVKSAALALVMAAANVVGVTERLSIVAAFADVDDSGSGELPS